jgi:putative acetyltransferase
VLGAAYEAPQQHGLSTEQLFEPNVLFFVARLDGLAVGCGGVAMFDDYAEVKQMDTYTRSAARGRGVATALLHRVEEAREAGRSVLRLETGTSQQEAIGLYERAGFRLRGSVRLVRCNAYPQHRDEPLFREGASVARMISSERPATA